VEYRAVTQRERIGHSRRNQMAFLHLVVEVSDLLKVLRSPPDGDHHTQLFPGKRASDRPDCRDEIGVARDDQCTIKAILCRELKEPQCDIHIGLLLLKGGVRPLADRALFVLAFEFSVYNLNPRVFLGTNEKAMARNLRGVPGSQRSKVEYCR
jgi:hypothetical protein